LGFSHVPQCGIVQDFVAELLQRVADGKDDVVRAAHPNGAVGFEDALATCEPFEIEFVVEFRPAGFVPVAFVHLHHFAGVTGDAAVGEEIGRVGKNHVEAAFGIFGGDGVEEFEAVAVVKAEEGGVGVEYQVRGVRRQVRSAGFQHGIWGLVVGTCRAGGRRSNGAVVAQKEVGGSNRVGVGEIRGRRAEGRGLASDFWPLASGFRLLTSRQTPRHAGIN
jgi:hypothetical protein